MICTNKYSEFRYNSCIKCYINDYKTYYLYNIFFYLLSKNSNYESNDKGTSP